MALTPLMQEWTRVREAFPSNHLVFFRLGDFYELFSSGPHLNPPK
jgi:DNA mismatch repair ATPase MutS